MHKNTRTKGKQSVSGDNVRCNIQCIFYSIATKITVMDHDGDFIGVAVGRRAATTRRFLLVVLLVAIFGSAGRSFCAASEETPDNLCCELRNALAELEEVGEGVSERCVSSAKPLPSHRVSYSFDASDRERRGKEDMRKEEYRRNGTYGSYHGEVYTI
ncbi:hypothetical protein OUZ56_006071 [Daphnia magna]|uniref:Uncharacterized protein n=1 Tax=Daphnia magna TaxID=35525 RepID=A0ABQ9YUK1_9CRUS|nr:hypothetical protein OUZ56_006071 [Daphnia magna]